MVHITRTSSSRGLLWLSLLLNVALGAAVAFGVYRLGGIDKAMVALKFKSNPAVGDYQDFQAKRFWDYPREAGDTVFLGDSLTADAAFSEYFSPMKNRGIGGQTTEQILERVDEAAREKPSKIFLLAGINDLAREVPVDTVVANYRKIVKAIHSASPQTKVFVESVLPVYPPKYSKDLNPQIQALNKQLESLASSEDCTWLNIAPAMSDANGILKAEYTKDGLHMTSEGKDAFLAALKPYVTGSPATQPTP